MSCCYSFSVFHLNAVPEDKIRSRNNFGKGTCLFQFFVGIQSRQGKNPEVLGSSKAEVPTDTVMRELYCFVSTFPPHDLLVSFRLRNMGAWGIVAFDQSLRIEGKVKKLWKQISHRVINATRFKSHASLMSVTVLNFWHVLTHLILMTTLPDRYYYYTHISDKETETLRS